MMASFLAILGLSMLSLHFHGGAPDSPLENVYRSVGLFSADTSWGFERPARCDRQPCDQHPPKFKNANLTYRVLAVVAPVLTALGAVQLITGSLGRVVLRAWLLLWVATGRRNVTGVFGLDEYSHDFATDMKRRGGRVFVVTNDQGNLLVDGCESAGIPVFGHRVRPRKPSSAACRPRPPAGRIRQAISKAAHWLRHPFPPHLRHCPRVLDWLLRHTHTIVSFQLDIGQQIELAEWLADWRPIALQVDRQGRTVSANARNRPAPIVPRLCLVTPARGLTSLLEDRMTLAADTRLASVRPRLLDVHAIAARKLLTEHRLDILADAFGQCRIHLAIYGLGTLGRAIVRQAAQLYITEPSLRGFPLRVTVFDRDGEAARASLLAEAPSIEQVVTIEIMPADIIRPGGLTEAQALHMLPPDVTAHILTFSDAQLAFTTALSMRRWLLEPPSGEQDWAARHRLAPIFVSAAAWTRPRGLGLRNADGIFSFGGQPGGLVAEALSDETWERGAKAVHDAYIAKLGAPRQSARPGETDWAGLLPALRESNFHAYDHIAIKARAIGFRLEAAPKSAWTPSWPPSKPRDGNTKDEDSDWSRRVACLAQLEHLRYMAERQASGWRRAPDRLDTVRVHHDLIAWNDLAADEQDLDDAQVDAMPDIAKAADLRLAEAFVIGISGYCAFSSAKEETTYEQWVCGELKKLRDANPARALVLLTCLAPGADSMAAEAAIALGIPYIVPLPLPYELLREDFLPPVNTTPDSLANFHDLLGHAEYAFEMPAVFGPASTLSRRNQPTQADACHPGLGNREKQYAHAAAYILQRAHAMIYVLDPGADPATDAKGHLTRRVLQWHTGKEQIDEEFATDSHFFPRPHCRREPILRTDQVPHHA